MTSTCVPPIINLYFKRKLSFLNINEKFQFAKGNLLEFFVLSLFHTDKYIDNSIV
jgi:hypothetical protein